MDRLVDVHSHFLPDFYVAAMRAAGHDVPDGIPGWPAWSVGAHLALMDEIGVERAVLSISSPGVHLGDPVATADLARRVNDEAARIVAGHPDRFAFFASLPLPDPTASVAELARAVDDLGAVGVVAETNVDGSYLGDAGWEPVLAELDRRGTVLFVHPTSPPGWERTALGRPRPVVEFLVDTTRTVARLLTDGVLDRHPGIDVVVPHCGAFLPLLVDRLDLFAAASGDGHGQRPGQALDRLWFDLAGTPMPVAAPTLADRVGTERLLYGSDYCFTPPPAVAAQVASLDERWPAERYGAWRELAAGNAARLLAP